MGLRRKSEPFHLRPFAVDVSDYNSGRWRRCAVLLLIAAFFLLPLVGCKHTPRQTSLWDVAPKVGWSGNRAEPTVPTPAEPSVGANVPASVAGTKAEPPAANGNEKPAVAESASPRTMPSLQAIVGAVTVSKPSSVERNAANAGIAQVDGQQPEPDFDNRPGQEQLERLEAALDQGTEQAGTARPAGSTHDVRVRVDALLEKSRRLFDLGELREARHAAKVAHELGDSARLDYSPDEERPIDLVLQIDDRMREVAEQADASPKPTEEVATNSISSNKPGTVNVAASTANPILEKPPAQKPPESDPTNKPRKDWTQSLSFVRRDRKQPVAPTPAAARPTATEHLPPAPAVQLGLETDAPTPEVIDGAVVQANRSLRLSTAPRSQSSTEPDSSEDPAISIESPRRELDSGSEPPEASIEAVSFAVNQPDLASNLRAWRATPATEETPDDDDPAVTDLAEVEPLSPFRDMAGPVPPHADDGPAITECRSSDYGWPIAITLFAGCTVVAIFWYRRGAV